MKLFDVYPLFDIEIKSGKGCYTYDTEGNEYLDLYGGHAVISIGHSHPYYINKITEQAQRLTFYSNSVKNSLQQQLYKSFNSSISTGQSRYSEAKIPREKFPLTGIKLIGAEKLFCSLDRLWRISSKC